MMLLVQALQLAWKHLSGYWFRASLYKLLEASVTQSEHRAGSR